MNNLEDYIVLTKGAMTTALCDAIVEEYATCDLWDQAKIYMGGMPDIVDENFRKVETISLSASSVVEENKKIRSAIDRYIYTTVARVLDSYRERFPSVTAVEDTGYELLRYKENCFYKEHIDCVWQNTYRELSCSIVLNSGYKGGEFSFFGGKKIYAPEKGDILMFPSNFMYPHAVLPVTEGERISIVTWFR